MPRISLPKKSLTPEQLLAAYWLDGRLQSNSKHSLRDRLISFTKEHKFKVADAAIAKAEEHLQNNFANEDIEQWVVVISFMGHPHAIWNFMLDAVALAKSEDHLERIACGLAETLLAHYGSLMSLFEERARKDPKFARMLTGVWRHRMCDDVWMRLRALQATIPLPLRPMIPLENGIDYMSEHLKPEDRNTPDKGMYSLDAKGNWVKKVG